MKRNFAFLLLFFTAFIFAQINIPSKSEKGMIVTKTNEKIYYSNLTFSDGKLKFINAQTLKEEFLYDASVLEIKENEISPALSEKTSSPMMVKKDKLTSDEEIKNYLLKSNDPQYIKGKKLNNLGTGFLIGGAACFVVGGLLNLSNANDSTEISSVDNKKGSPVPLIIGLGGMGAGLIMKLSGHSQMKKAIDDYKTASIFSKENLKENLSIVANNNGLGLQLRF